MALGLVACASTTRFDSTWKAPEAGPLNFQGRKVAALVMSDNTATRFSAEELLAKELKARGVEGIPAYDLIPQSETRDKDRAKALFNQAGIAGVVVLRAAGVQKEIVSSGGYWAFLPTDRSGSRVRLRLERRQRRDPHPHRHHREVETMVHDSRRTSWSGPA